MNIKPQQKRPAEAAPVHEEPALKQPRLLDRPAAAEEDDLGFLLELRRVYGTVVELPRRQTRQERLAKIIRRQKLTATTEDQQENTEDADADVEASVPLCPAPPESIWRALELLDLELLKQWVDYDEYCMHERDDDLRQPLCVAMELGFERAIKLLIKRGAPLLDIDGKGWSCLHYAVRDYDRMPANLLPHLLRHCSIPIDQRGGQGDAQCAIHLATSDKPLKWLLSCGADPSLPQRQEGDVIRVRDLVSAWPAGTEQEAKRRRRAMAFLSRAPYQAYHVEKLCFIASTSRPGMEGGGAGLEASVLDSRVRGELVSAEDGEEPVCWEMVPGQVFGLEREGQVFLLRLDSSSSHASSLEGKQPLSSLLQAGAEAFDDRGMRSPSPVTSGTSSMASSPLRLEPEPSVAAYASGEEAGGHEEARGASGQGLVRLREEDWVLLDPLPRIEFHDCSEDAREDMSLAGHVLAEVVMHLPDRTLLELLSYMW